VSPGCRYAGLWRALSNTKSRTSPYAVSVSSNADGAPTSVSLGSSGDTIGSTYDNSGSPSLIALKNGSTLESFSYSYQPSGGVQAETGTGAGTTNTTSCGSLSNVSTCNGFDRQTRLGTSTIHSGSQLYTAPYLPDEDANLSSLPQPLTTTPPTAAYDKADELTSSTQSGTTTSYNYDCDGQLASQVKNGTTTVTAVADAGGNITAYNNTNATANTGANMSSATYNGDGLRVAETTTPSGGSQISQNFTYDMSSGASILLMNSNYAFVYAGDGTIEQVTLTTGAVDYLLADGGGSVRGVVNGLTGALTASTTYDAFANPTTAVVSQGGVNYPGLTVDTPVGYGGSYTDPTGLIGDGSGFTDPATDQSLSKRTGNCTWRHNPASDPYGPVACDPSRLNGDVVAYMAYHFLTVDDSEAKSLARTHAQEMVGAAAQEDQLENVKGQLASSQCQTSDHLARGLFQLCDAKLIAKAGQFGGWQNPWANTFAILKGTSAHRGYLWFWKNFPKAPEGDASDCVDASSLPGRYGSESNTHANHCDTSYHRNAPGPNGKGKGFVPFINSMPPSYIRPPLKVDNQQCPKQWCSFGLPRGGS
jgi:YD repeat-containing protein